MVQILITSVLAAFLYHKTRNASRCRPSDESLLTRDKDRDNISMQLSTEVLRKWPPAVALNRLCVHNKKNYNLGKPNKDSTCDYIVRKGKPLMIPVWAIHCDPDYYPNPEKFDPKRFCEENKDLIKPLTYILLGLRPRNCVGSRFALYEMNQQLLHMELSRYEKTNVTRKLSTILLIFDWMAATDFLKIL